jgi:CHAD domain-containing protein
LEYLKNIFKTPLDPGMLHEGRKQIKHILYIQELISPPLKKKIRVHFKNLDELQSLIGKWHDSMVYHDSLRDFKVNKNQKGMKELRRKIKDQLEFINEFRLDKSKEIFFS